MYALVLVTRDGEELGQGRFKMVDIGVVVKLELEDDASVDMDTLEQLVRKLSNAWVHVGDSAEVEDLDDGSRYKIEVTEVYLDYGDIVRMLPSAQGLVILNCITGRTTDDRLREIAEYYAGYIRGQGYKPNMEAIKWWLDVVRDTASEVEQAWDMGCVIEYPSPLDLEVEAALKRLREMEGD